MNAEAIAEPRWLPSLPARPRPARPRKLRLHPGIDPATSGLLAVVLLAVFSGLGIEVSLALPLAVLLGLTGQKFLDLILYAESRDVFAPSVFVALYFAVYFGLRTIYLQTAAETVRRVGLNPYDDYLPAALWCASLGYISFTLGFNSRWGTARSDGMGQWNLTWPRAFPALRVLAVLAVGLASLVYLFSIGIVVGNYDNPEFVRNPPPGLPILLEKTVFLGWIAICICMMLPRKRASENSIEALPMIALSLGLLFLRLAISGSKDSLVEPIVDALIIYHYLRRRLRAWELAAIAVPTILLAFGAVNFYRFVVVGELGGAPTSLEELTGSLSTATDYLSHGGATGRASAMDQMMTREAGVDALALVIKYTPERVPYGYGKDLLLVPLSLIPRKLWPDKPRGSVGNLFETGYMGMPGSYLGFSSIHLISDFYRNFNLFGVVGGMYLVGAAFRFFYRFCAPASRNAAGVFLYAALLPSVGGFLEGDAGTVLITFSRSCLLAIATALFLGVRFRRRVPGQQPPMRLALRVQV